MHDFKVVTVSQNNAKKYFYAYTKRLLTGHWEQKCENGQTLLVFHKGYLVYATYVNSLKPSVHYMYQQV